MSAIVPRATYRFQFHKGFTFADAQARLPYLQALGISHLYASPITTARPGSHHGYDVVDPTRINPELGGEAGLVALVADLRARDMGLVIDIVPNHMGIGQHNGWWMDVLANGPTSRYAPYFDIDWTRGDGRMVLPFLGAPLEETLAAGDLALETLEATGEVFVCAYGDTRYPLRPETVPASPERPLYAASTAEGRQRIARLLDQQHYRLEWWRAGHDTLNWRRFFSVTELAGLRVEDTNVFETTHALYFRLFAEGRIDGVRIDHVDGLADPTGYLVSLRQRLDAMAARRPGSLAGQKAWIVVEKILAPDEPLPSCWPVAGTSGYEFMETVNAVLHAPGAEALLTEAWSTISGRSARFKPEEVLARDQMLEWEFSAQRDQAVDALFALARDDGQARRFTRAMISRALDALVKVFPVYRTYGTGADALPEDSGVRRDARMRAEPHIAPGETMVVDWILDVLAGSAGAEGALAAQRVQQLTAPIAAKAVEDTAFYRYGRLLSRNDVGAEPALLSLSPNAFHERIARQAERFPHAMLTTATHDHKRGEDVRCRIAAISHEPRAWLAAFERLREAFGARLEGVDSGDFYMLAQMLAGIWPEDSAILPVWTDRLKGWQQKAVREAKLRSSWVAPDADYEARLEGLIDWVTTGPDAQAARGVLNGLRDTLTPHARRLNLCQTVLKFTLPGVPDTYQGTEIEDFSLVDPDNRRAVDFAAIEAALARQDPPAKLSLIAELLALRRAAPDLFAHGHYIPIAAPEGILAFGRILAGETLVVVLALEGGADTLSRLSLPLPSTLAVAGDAFRPVGPEGHPVAASLLVQGIAIRAFSSG